jgi:MoxR-like ATPase
LAPSVLRHRVLLNFHAEAERITTDTVIARLLEEVPEPSSGL